MSFFTKKGLPQKMLISILMILLLFNFVYPNYVHASWGGVLFNPIMDLITSIGDIGVKALHALIYGGWSWWDNGDIFIEVATGKWYGGVINFFKSIGEFLTFGFMDIEWEINGGISINQSYYNVMGDLIPNTFKIPIFLISPYEIFANKMPLLDVNFINPKTDYTRPEYYEDGTQGDVALTNKDGTDVESSATQLRNMISSWYTAIRNLAIVGLLSVLVYIGIRILVSSASKDKAKYKAMLTDWLVAMCLIFFMHYIMAFALTITEELTKIFEKENGNMIIVLPAAVSEKLGVGDKPIAWTTNFMGYARVQMQLIRYNDTNDYLPEGQSYSSDAESANIMHKFTYMVIYLALVIFTYIFLFQYLKRLIYLAFLTLIAPLVALTYPIDKIRRWTSSGF